MRDRCKRSGTHYVKRGISVCPEWEVFEKFFEDMGEPPTTKHTIDRINNALGYSKGNCRWATMAEQSLNKSNNRLVAFNGKTQTAKEWADELGLPYDLVIARLMNGFTPENAFSPERLTRRSAKPLTINGVTKPLVQWAKEANLSIQLLKIRVKANWPEGRLLDRPANRGQYSVK